MTFTTILYNVRDHVAYISINRPERHNALTWTAMDEVAEALGLAGSDAEVRVVVISAVGERSFCAGADLAGMTTGGDFASLHDGRGAMPRLMRQMWELGKPTIARVFGNCLAGGFGLALSCDFLIAADTSVFSTPEIDRGIWPYMITVPMRHSMPPKVALELLMTGRRVEADEALRLGFANRVVPMDRLDAAVEELAATLASKAPTAMRLGRTSFYDTWDRPAGEVLPQLHAMLTVTASTDEAAEGIAAFMEKRDPVW